MISHPFLPFYWSRVGFKTLYCYCGKEGSGLTYENVVIQGSQDTKRVMETGKTDKETDRETDRDTDMDTDRESDRVRSGHI